MLRTGLRFIFVNPLSQDVANCKNAKKKKDFSKKRKKKKQKKNIFPRSDLSVEFKWLLNSRDR